MSNPPSIEIVSPKNLYKWASVWGKIQKDYYKESVYLRREKQIEDFILLNEFKNIYVKKDTDILKNLVSVESPAMADLVLITDQKFSRIPCVAIVDEIQRLLNECPKLFICLNRHYINIDNSYLDTSLSEHFPLAITQWLKKNLKDVRIIDMSLDYLDRGDYFTWVIADRMYYIEKL
jgi:hypothetical protein